MNLKTDIHHGLGIVHIVWSLSWATCALDLFMTYRGIL